MNSVYTPDIHTFVTAEFFIGVYTPLQEGDSVWLMKALSFSNLLISLSEDLAESRALGFHRCGTSPWKREG